MDRDQAFERMDNGPRGKVRRACGQWNVVVNEGVKVLPKRFDRRASCFKKAGGSNPLIKLGVLALACVTVISNRSTGRDKTENMITAVNGSPVELPPFVVRAMRIDKTPWSYAAVPGFEILSRASTTNTGWMLDALRRGKWLEEQLLPPDWLTPAPLPYTVIIDDTDVESTQSGEVHLQLLKLNPPADALTWGRFSSEVRVTTERLGAGDQDTYAISRNVRGSDTNRAILATISLERLTRSTPPLPSWLNAGLLGSHAGIFRESFIRADNDDGGVHMIGNGQNHEIIRSAAGPGALWISLEETERLLAALKTEKKRHELTKIAMLPLRQLFTETPDPGTNPLLWESEAALFARWALMGPGHEDPALSQAFLDFVRRARREPVTEPIFRECFGFGYGTMEEKLEAFLRTVIAKPNHVRLNFPPDFPEPDLKPATTDQIGRLLGDWLRMEGESFRRSDPELRSKLFYAAGRVLRRTYQYDNGLPPDAEPSSPGTKTARPSRNPGAESIIALEPFVVTAARIHDPALLAVYGLYSHDSGDDTKAREFLGKAVKTGATRPTASLVLAQLNYADAMTHPLGAGGKISQPQALAILAPLSAVLKYPLSFDAYALIALTWLHCEAKAPEDDVARIVEGVERFPRSTQLAYSSALVCAGSGDLAHAAALVDRGLLFVTEDAERARFEHLREMLRR